MLYEVCNFVPISLLKKYFMILYHITESKKITVKFETSQSKETKDGCEVINFAERDFAERGSMLYEVCNFVPVALLKNYFMILYLIFLNEILLQSFKLCRARFFKIKYGCEVINFAEQGQNDNIKTGYFAFARKDSHFSTIFLLPQ